MSIEFQEKSAIYQQIADYGINQVLHHAWEVGDKVPSVRQLAAEVGVNPNTVMHAYTYLQQQGILLNKRGLGLFVDEQGLEKAIALRKREFIERTLPRLIEDLRLLQISPTELVDILNNHQN